MHATAIKTIRGETMGGTWSVRLAAVHADPAREVQAILDRLDAQMSAWKPDSDLCRVNRAPLGQWIELPPEMSEVVAAGLDMMTRFPSSFSICLGGASARWGFMPGEALGIAATTAAVEFESGRFRRLMDVALDLNALAKGFAADRVGAALAALDIGDCLVEVAGDIFARGLRPDGLPWTVALELPIAGKIVPARPLPLPGGGIATSGSYRRQLGAHCHLFSPSTGEPLSADFGSVTVMAPTAMMADALATAFAVLGPDRGLKLANATALPIVYLARGEGGMFVERGSTAMSDLVGDGTLSALL